MANGRGGARAGAGRKKGGKNQPKFNLEKTSILMDPEALLKMTPLGFLMATYRDPSIPFDTRRKAAADALPYTTPKKAPEKQPELPFDSPQTGAGAKTNWDAILPN